MADPAESSALVVEFLRDHDVACPTCLYNLRQASSNRCPECGTPLHLEVTGSVSGAFWWLASVIGCSVGLLVAGTALLHLLGDLHKLLDEPRLPQMVAAGMVSMSELPRWGALVWVTTLVSSLGIALAWLVTSRRTFGRMTRQTRIPLGLACGLMPVIVLGLLRLVIWF